MREVIRLDKKEESKKPVEFLEYYSVLNSGWRDANNKPNEFNSVLYRETIDGLDYFIVWYSGDETVSQYRGHLNSGKY